MKRVYFLHPDITNLDEMISYMHIDSLDIVKSLIWDEKMPDYIIISEHIYWNRKMFHKFRAFLQSGRDVIYIFFTGECIEPDMNIFDYAVVFDRKLKNNDRISRIPPNFFHTKSLYESTNTLTFEGAKELLKWKSQKFCCFIYSNANAHPMRDKIFYKLSEYKKVDSLGAHLNNAENVSGRTSSDWRQTSIIMKSNYKFSIASENAIYEGYTSEKILSSFQSHSVPVYWGNPYVADEYNCKAFINCNEYESMDEVLKKIKEIDNDDNLWCNMVTQPWQTGQQLAAMEEEMNDYLYFINNIFMQSFKKAQRRPHGTYPDEYLKFFMRSYGIPKFEFRKWVVKLKKLPYKIKSRLKKIKI